MRSLLSWTIAIVALLVLADFVFGLDFVLNTISTIFVIALSIVVALGAAAVAALIFWLLIRDAVDEIRSDRAEGRAWRWRCIGWIGIAGMLVDGAIGAWNVYQHHVLFSTAVEEIPFAGVPVLLTLASIPLRFAEEILMKMGKKSKGTGL